MTNTEIFKHAVSRLERDFTRMEFEISPALLRVLREQLGSELLAEMVTIHPDKAHFQYKGSPVPDSIQKEYEKRYSANLKRIQEI